MKRRLTHPLCIARDGHLAETNRRLRERCAAAELALAEACRRAARLRDDGGEAEAHALRAALLSRAWEDVGGTTGATQSSLVPMGGPGEGDAARFDADFGADADEVLATVVRLNASATARLREAAGAATGRLRAAEGEAAQLRRANTLAMRRSAQDFAALRVGFDANTFAPVGTAPLAPSRRSDSKQARTLAVAAQRARQRAQLVGRAVAAAEKEVSLLEVA